MRWVGKGMRKQSSLPRSRHIGTCGDTLFFMSEHISAKTLVLAGYILFWACPLFGASSVVISSQSTAKPRLVGYFWGKALRSGFRVQDAPTTLLSDLIYSNVRPSANDMCEMTHPDIDPQNFTALRSLKEREPALKLLLSIAGNANRFSEIAASPERTRRFADSCVELAIQNGFDGLDIDWEHPVNGGIPIEPTRTRHPEDRANYVLLLKAFRSSLDLRKRHGLLLTVATAGYYDHLADFNLRGMARYVDWFNLMIYDMSDMNPHVTADSSPLYEPADRAKAAGYKLQPSSANYAVDWYLAHGVKAEKIVLGVPFYGHEWTGVPPVRDGLFTAYEKHVTKDDPLPYWQIQEQFPYAKRYWDRQAKSSWLYDQSTGVLVSFDDEHALTEKAKYVDEHGLGGIMFWDLTEDTKSFELLRTLADALGKEQP